jgi:hypothetical protein
MDLARKNEVLSPKAKLQMIQQMSFELQEMERDLRIEIANSEFD